MEKSWKALLAVWLGGSALRLLLSPEPGSSSTPLLTSFSNELGSPQTSLLSLKECLFYYKNGLPLYSNTLCHQPPLIVALFDLLPEPWYTPVFIAVDTVIAVLIALVYAHLWTPRNAMKDAASIIALYYLNPLIVLSSCSQSLISLNNLSLIAAIYLALHRKRSLALFSLAVGTYLSLYPVILLPAILLIVSRSSWISFAFGVFNFTGWLVALFGLSFLLLAGPLPFEMLLLLPASIDELPSLDALADFTGNFTAFMDSDAVAQGWHLYHSYLNSVYGFILTIPDLTPNIGLYWYFFTEMFDASRSFFLYILQLHIFSLSLPLSIKFRSDPVFCVTLLSGIIAVFKSYPTFGDLGFWISAFLPLQKHLITYLRKPLVTFALLGTSAVLLPIFRFIWIYAGSGNSNFYYAMTLVWCFGGVFLLLDVTFAWLRRDWDRLQAKTDLKDVDVQME